MLFGDLSLFVKGAKIYGVALSISLFSASVGSLEQLSFRQYQHVKMFYQEITPAVLEVSEKYQLPAAAILAIAGLESGYGSGYVSQITGNILSLGAFSHDKELPALFLPYSSELDKVIFDPAIIKQQSEADLNWQQRPKSLKRDYRPSPYAGTNAKLELLTEDNALKSLANRACMKDFATRWIVTTSKVNAFKDARLWLDQVVSKNGADRLYNDDINQIFIGKIGGHPRSFNHRGTWPKKVALIMQKVGLVALVNDIKNNNLSFNEAWRKLPDGESECIGREITCTRFYQFIADQVKEYFGVVSR
jgi:hypothetical protein